MISQPSDETITTVHPGTHKESKQGLKSRKYTAKTFDFLWKRDARESTSKKEQNQWKREDLLDVKVVESKLKDAPKTKMPFDFFRNIKKRMHIKNITICKSKQKVKEIETSNCPIQDSLSSVLPTISTTQEKSTAESNYENVSTSSNTICTAEGHESSSLNQHFSQEPSRMLEHKVRNINLGSEQCTNKTEIYDDSEKDCTDIQSCSNAPSDNALQQHVTETINDSSDVQANISETVNTDNKVKASLTEELLKLSKYGWYWGPISGVEADAKLISEPDGAFLVRDSSDDRYVLTLSFKSSGKLLHARMEHTGGLFSLCNQSESEGFTSVAALIDHSMNFSQTAVFCYSRPKYPGYPSFPVRLTKPVSRFTQVRSLQYLCRFVIRENTRLDNIHKLPLPKTIKGYIEEAHY